jgi:hypothetical protein
MGNFGITDRGAVPPPGLYGSGGAPGRPDFLAPIRRTTRSALPQDQFERELSKLENRYIDPNITLAEKRRLESEAGSLISRQGYGSDNGPISNQPLFMRYLQRDFGHAPIPSNPIVTANGWEIQELDDFNDPRIQILNRPGLNDNKIPSVTLGKNNWHAYIRDNTLYVCRKGAKPDGKHLVALKIPLQSSGSNTAPRAYGSTGEYMLGVLNGQQ